MRFFAKDILWTLEMAKGKLQKHLLLPRMSIPSKTSDRYDEISVERNVAIPMRDGVRLYANIYKPGAKRRFPVILIRLPYGKDEYYRASYRESDRNPSPIEPGQVYEYGIDLWAASYVVKAGHRIRVEISSSNLNRFDRNPNTGEPFEMATDPITAHQQIFHTTEYPSRITLPINLGEPHPNLNACQTERRLK